jgi:hypothetical protein
MEKILTNSHPVLSKNKVAWLDVKSFARIEATSEDSRYPIESAFEIDGRGWRAVELGEQTIRLIFHEPQRIKRIQLCFMEPDTERTQRFTLQWSTDQTGAMRPLIQQEWNFSPTGSIIQIEDHEVDLEGVRMLQLIVSPEIKRGSAVATMASWRLAYEGELIGSRRHEQNSRQRRHAARVIAAIEDPTIKYYNASLDPETILGY